MKMSQVTEEQLLSLTPEQKWEVVCGGIHDEGKTADYALLLGTRPERAAKRARGAAKVYLDGRVKYIVPSGGVEWDFEGERLSEANYMKRVLIEDGVPEGSVILENEARTTKENMIYGALQLNRKTKFYNGKRVMIVTSINHMKRSMALAKAFLPRFVEISYYPSEPDHPYEQLMSDTSLLDSELHLMWSLVNHGLVDDIEFNISQ